MLSWLGKHGLHNHFQLTSITKQRADVDMDEREVSKDIGTVLGLELRLLLHCHVTFSTDTWHRKFAVSPS